MRKHSFVFLPCLCKKQADTNCKASLAYWFRDNLFGFDAAWLTPSKEKNESINRKEYARDNNLFIFNPIKRLLANVFYCAVCLDERVSRHQLMRSTNITRLRTSLRSNITQRSSTAACHLICSLLFLLSFRQSAYPPRQYPKIHLQGQKCGTSRVQSCL